MKLENHFTEAEILQNFKAQAKYEQFAYWQIIYSVLKNPGRDCKEISEILGQPEWKVFRVVERYNREGRAFKGTIARGGRRDATSYLTIEEEYQLLSEVTKKALKGLVLTYNDIKGEVEQKLNKTVSDDYIWDLFKRHGWVKKAPIPNHPKKDPAKGEEFKKNLKRIWQPPH